MVFTLKITGPQNMEAAFSDFSTNMTRYAIEIPIRFAFTRAEQIAKTEVHVRTGFLRSSIRSEYSSRGGRLVAAAPYALYHNAINPYFTHAVDEVIRILPLLVSQAIAEQAGRLTRKWFGG